jgi:hypothetical protein
VVSNPTSNIDVCVGYRAVEEDSDNNNNNNNNNNIIIGQ